MNPKTSVVILAAGKGTRMRSELPKVLHPVAQKPMLLHAIEAAQKIDPAQIVVVVGYGAGQVQDAIDDDVDFVLQQPQLGTGHAAQLALQKIRDDAGDLIVSYGDMPLLTADIFRDLRAARRRHQVSAVVLTTTMDPPPAFGRIVRDAAGQLLSIVEDKDCSPAQKAITEVNVAVYCFALGPLKRALARLRNNNAQNEYYLTDVIALLRQDGERVEAMHSDDVEACIGVNDLDDLARVEQIMARRTRHKH